MTFICVIIFSAFDFWTVKNVTGRILVNLRWWYSIDITGKENWVFESLDETKVVGKTDSFVFWSTTYGTPLVWVVFGILDLISLKFFWMTACVISFMLSSINANGYQKCKKDHK